MLRLLVLRRPCQRWWLVAISGCKFDDVSFGLKMLSHRGIIAAPQLATL